MNPREQKNAIPTLGEQKNAIPTLNDLKGFNRRDFLKLATAVGGWSLLAGCKNGLAPVVEFFESTATAIRPEPASETPTPEPLITAQSTEPISQATVTPPELEQTAPDLTMEAALAAEQARQKLFEQGLQAGETEQMMAVEGFIFPVWGTKKPGRPVGQD
jgi:hypothetical protein